MHLIILRAVPILSRNNTCSYWRCDYFRGADHYFGKNDFGYKNEKIQHYILFQLGISVSEYTHFTQGRIKNMFVFPGIVASIMGAVFLCMTIFTKKVLLLCQNYGA